MHFFQGLPTCPALEMINIQDGNFGLQLQVPCGGTHLNGVGSELAFFFLRISVDSANATDGWCEQNILTRSFSRHFHPYAHMTLWRMTCLRKNVHAHVITCVSVCCFFVLSSSSVSRASSFSLTFTCSLFLNLKKQLRIRKMINQYCPVATHNPLTGQEPNQFDNPARQFRLLCTQHDVSAQQDFQARVIGCHSGFRGVRDERGSPWKVQQPGPENQTKWRPEGWGLEGWEGQHFVLFFFSFSSLHSRSFSLSGVLFEAWGLSPPTWPQGFFGQNWFWPKLVVTLVAAQSGERERDGWGSERAPRRMGPTGGARDISRFFSLSTPFFPFLSPLSVGSLVNSGANRGPNSM